VQQREETKNAVKDEIGWGLISGDMELQGLSSIAAVTENRAKEVGIAIYTRYKHRVLLSQIVDSALYSETGKESKVEKECSGSHGEV
jgi:hypothetical protein